MHTRQSKSPRLLSFFSLSLSHTHRYIHTQGGRGVNPEMGRRASALATSVWTRHTRAPTNPRDAFRNLAPGWEGAAPACPPLCPAPPSTIRRSGEVQSSVAPLPALLHQGGPRHVGPHTQHRCGICQDFRGWSQLGSGQAPIPVQPRSMLSGTKGRVAPLGDFVAQEISPLQKDWMLPPCQPRGAQEVLLPSLFSQYATLGFLP